MTKSLNNNEGSIMKNKLSKRRILSFLKVFIGLIVAACFLFGGTIAFENDLNFLGFGCIMISVYIMLIANSNLTVTEIRGMLENMNQAEKEDK